MLDVKIYESRDVDTLATDLHGLLQAVEKRTIRQSVKVRVSPWLKKVYCKKWW